MSENSCEKCGYSWIVDAELLESLEEECPLCRWRERKNSLVNNMMKLQSKVNKSKDNRDLAIDILCAWGNARDVEHKTWAINEALKVLMGEDKYMVFMEDMMHLGHTWSVGVAP